MIAISEVSVQSNTTCLASLELQDVSSPPGGPLAFCGSECLLTVSRNRVPRIVYWTLVARHGQEVEITRESRRDTKTQTGRWLFYWPPKCGAMVSRGQPPEVLDLHLQLASVG